MSKQNASNDTPTKPTADELAFVAAYFENNMNGTRAYMSLHPKSSYDAARSSAPVILAKPSIKDEIKRRLNEKAMSAEEAIARIGEIARADLYPFIRRDNDGFVYFNFSDPQAMAYLFLIKKIKTKRERRLEGAEVWEGEWVEVELHDAYAALRDIAKMHGKLDKPDKQPVVTESARLTIPADLIAPDFFASHRAIHSGKHTEFVEFGGRGSTKSSFISVEIIELLVNHPDVNALATRQVKDTLRDSVYAQLVWAIEMLGMSDSFKCTTSPLEIEYLPTGQQIFFRGADDPGKIKSIKPKKGYIGILWFEELDSFRGPEVVRNIEQSAIRGGDLAWIFKSFNPPRTAGNWANKYTKIPKDTQWQHSSNYINVPIEWLGKVFTEEAAHLKEVNPDAYEHEYMGVPNFAGGMVFPNAVIEAITDEQLKEFDHIYHGLDWGYALDPLHWVKLHYDAKKEIIYIFDEFRANGMSNHRLYEVLTEEKKVKPDDMIIADSAEPKSVGDMREYGLTCRAAEKGPDSVRYSIRWLQNRARIVIDNKRCPHTAQEFLDYEYEQTKDGEWISEYPDKNNHAIDSVRYALNLQWRRRGQ
jgi:phage terminase large subunit